MRAAALAVTYAWRVQAGPPTETVMVTAPMASGGPEIDMTIWQTAFTSSTSKTHDSHAHVNGHLVKVSNPLGRVAVVPPLPGGCGTIAYVPDTAALYNPSCILATDAGYYNLIDTFQCIGNVVSDGEIHYTEPMNTTNVNFGVLKNGSFVIGYISPETVETGIFEHLVGGLGWIVRNGSNNVDAGWEEAYTAAGSSGDEYKEMTSGRTTIGWDKDGGLILLQYDGHTGAPSWGATMNELADKMISFGAVEAINLDGGGSTQMWKHGVQIGYSSDRATYGVLAGTYEVGCPIGEGKGNLSAFECARKVSTIICIHEDNSGIRSFLGPASMQAASPVSGLSLATLVIGLGIGGAVGFVAQKMWSKKKGQGAQELSEDDSE